MTHGEAYSLGEYSNLVAVDDKLAILDCDIALEDTVNGVVLEHVNHVLEVNEPGHRGYWSFQVQENKRLMCLCMWARVERRLTKKGFRSRKRRKNTSDVGSKYSHGCTYGSLIATSFRGIALASVCEASSAGPRNPHLDIAALKHVSCDNTTDTACTVYGSALPLPDFLCYLGR